MSEEDKDINTPQEDMGVDENEAPEEEEKETPFFNFSEEESEGEDSTAKEEGALKEEPKDSSSGQKDFVSKEEYESFKRESQVSNFLNNPQNEDYKEFGDEITKLAKHPASKGLTIDAIARLAVPKDHWIQKGAEMSSEANEKSRKTFTSGSSARDEVGKSGSQKLGDPYDIKDPVEFMAEAERIARESRDA